MNSSTIKKYILCIMGILFIIIVLKYDIGIPCMFHMITGFYCPGCGATRAIRELTRFNIYQAFRYNALIIILFPFVIAYIIYKYIFKGKKNIPNNIFVFLLIVTILFGILRNISIFYFFAPNTI